MKRQTPLVRERSVFAVVAATSIASAACARLRVREDEALSGGAATVFDATRAAFSLPSPALSEAMRAAFFVGNSFFNENWVTAPASVETRDGLGPLFNARSCSSCHFRDGRGRPPEPGQSMVSMLLRVSVPGSGPHGAPRPDPTYGDQIQGGAVAGVPREADVVVDYEERSGAFGDGEPYTLRRPKLRLRHLAYGPVAPGLLTSGRVAPAMIGLGLLEGVSEADLQTLADPDDRDGDGVSGRLNEVWDVGKRAVAVGRFGWKAEQPSVLQQSAGAFRGDMGITSGVFGTENHTPNQEACASSASGGEPEVRDDILRAVVVYARSLGVPARRNVDDPTVMRGAELFEHAGCSSCHSPTLKAARLEGTTVGEQTFHPYTDLLLHDMGEDLADHRPAFAADGREWRTAPLWGIGLTSKVSGHTFFLHDGRARNLSEAIVWHGGEASRARDVFVAMPKSERRALLTFLESL